MINVNSTLEEVNEYLSSEEAEKMDWKEFASKVEPIVMIVAAQNSVEFDIGYESDKNPTTELLSDLIGGANHASKYSEGGRWHNYVTDIFKYDVEGETYYVAIEWEQAATESQEHGNLEVYEVEPVEVTVTEWERK